MEEWIIVTIDGKQYQKHPPDMVTEHRFPHMRKMKLLDIMWGGYILFTYGVLPPPDEPKYYWLPSSINDRNPINDIRSG